MGTEVTLSMKEAQRLGVIQETLAGRMTVKTAFCARSGARNESRRHGRIHVVTADAVIQVSFEAPVRHRIIAQDQIIVELREAHRHAS